MTTADSAQADKPKILIAGDATVPTGFGRVLEGIFRPLVDKYDIHHLGANYHGDPHNLPWKVYPASLGGGVWGSHRLAKLIADIQPRLLFIANDIWVHAEYLEALAKIENPPPVVLYCPVDAGPIEPDAMAPLAGVQRFVTYTNFGKQEIDKALHLLREREGEFEFPEVEVMPHGVDTDVFHPLGEDPKSRLLAARRALFPDQEELHHAFIVLNANRNQPRKRIDITMKGFALFAEGKPDDVKLYLHMGAEDQGWNVVQLARRFDLEGRLLMSTVEKMLPHFSTKHLNHVYNACQVGINTAVGEGWGLISFEHAATGAAQIVPRHGACAELWNEAAVMVDPVMSLTTIRLLTEGKIVSPEGVAEALEKLYNDPQLLTDMSTAAYTRATERDYLWSNISARWDSLFEEVMRDSDHST